MRRKARVVFFICSAIRDGELVSKMIEASTLEESYSLFEKEHGVKPQVVHGPVYQKKTGTLDKNFDIKFKFGQNKQGTYNGWHVTAMPLLSPTDSVYLLYNKRVDGQKTQKPNAMVIKAKEIQDLK